MTSKLVCLNTSKDTHRLILLHGWGADADDLIPLGEALTNGLDKKVEIVALRAPFIHPQGIGRQWYPLFPPEWTIVPGEIKSLQNRIKEITSEKIPLKNTVVLGFSQGGAMALGCCSNLPLAGLISCSGYPHPNWEIEEEFPPVLISHGRNDEVVPFIAAEKISEILESKGFSVEKILFDGGHEIPQYIFPKIQLTLKYWFS